MNTETTDAFDVASAEWRDDLIALLRELQSEIADDYRATDDPSDDTPAMQVTIATDDALTDWTYQTGDNSYMGSCYHYPHWGISSITRDNDPAEVADALLADLGEQWASNNI